MRAELRKPIKSSPELRQVIARFEDDVAEAARDAKRQRTDDEETITLHFEENQLSQSDLAALAASALGRHLQHLHIRPEYEDVNPHILDFEGVSFPQLKSLEMNSQAICALDFTAAYTPLLENIDIEEPCAVSVSYVYLKLPLLKNLWLKRVTLDCSEGFDDSISRCPRLECLGGYKIWGLATTKSKPLRLVCPAVKHICFWRADDLNYLKIWAPKLEELDLTGAFDIDTVQLMIRRPKDFSGPEYDVLEGQVPAKYCVNLSNTRYGYEPKSHYGSDSEDDGGNEEFRLSGQPDLAGNLLTHERCRRIIRRERI